MSDALAKVAPSDACILTINGGSSSIRFALYATDPSLRLATRGKVERIGLSGTRFTVKNSTGETLIQRDIGVDEQGTEVKILLDWLEAQPAFAAISAVAHRVVHGMAHSAPERITPDLLNELRRLVSYVPEHLPREIELIDAVQQRFPGLPQIACFDTAFHRSMPRIARLLPIPHRYQADGVQRYGFHGLSYAYLMEELERLGDPAATQGRVILAHLGNGASVAAVLDGESIDTSMGFTPSSGLMMSTRSGDLDPGLSFYLAQAERMSATDFQHMVNHESGLLGVSGSSADMRDLLAQENENVRAAEAVALFCYQAKKWIGSCAAVLGGVDTLVFAGGIGEKASTVRARICAGLGFLGIELDEQRNAVNDTVISGIKAPVKVHVIPTDEEVIIAKSACRVLEAQNK